ncbi:MAG: 1,4-dihydroxy-2-naphthoate polyprenyltransferase [Spirochaetales bacterium]|nr:1,4-dihydroxy-2-naphthoate polyprenyltransferase [Spirochaetales bacterium]
MTAWLLAARPKTLPASTSGVIVGSALAFAERHFDLWSALLSFFVALCLQIASNFANDVFDFESGADAGRSHGPTRVTQAGLLTPRQVKSGLLVVLILATLAGIGLIVHSLETAPGAWPWLSAMGLFAIAASVGYTTGPFPLARLGLGDVFVLVFFGFVATVGSYFVQTGHLELSTFLLSLGPGLIIVAILVVNNLRDLDEDRKAQKKTLAARFGERFAKTEYVSCLSLAYVVLALVVASGLTTPWVLLTFLSLPLAFKNVRLILTARGSALNAALAGTGALSFIWALLFALGMILSSTNQ